MTSLPKIGALLWIEFLRLTAFRATLWSGVIHCFIRCGGGVLLWKSLLEYRSVETPAGPIGEAEMLSYVLVSQVIASVVDFRLIDDINDRMVRGQVAVDLLRPVSFPTQILAKEFARVIFVALTQAIPVALAFSLVLDVRAPSVSAVCLYLPAVTGGVLIALLIAWSVGVLALWLVNTVQVKFALQGVTALLSGAVVPLWFFPFGLDDVARVLPFHLIFFAPGSVWLGTYSGAELTEMFIQMLVWIALLSLLARATWRAVVRRVQVQGG